MLTLLDTPMKIDVRKNINFSYQLDFTFTEDIPVYVPELKFRCDKADSVK